MKKKSKDSWAWFQSFVNNPFQTIPTSRYTSCELLVPQECLDKSLHLTFASVWVPEHETRVQTLHLPNCCIFQGTLLLCFSNDVREALCTFPPKFKDPELWTFTVPNNKKYMSLISKWSLSTTWHEVITLANYVTSCNRVYTISYLLCLGCLSSIILALHVNQYFTMVYHQISYIC